MRHQNECNLSPEEVKYISRVRKEFLILFICIAALWVIALTSCASHFEKVQSAEKTVSVAKKNDDLAKAALMMRVSDYGQEARFTASLLPKSAEANAIEEILALQIQLAGKGSLSEQERELFVQKLIRAGADAQLALANAATTDASLQKKVQEKDGQLIEANDKLHKVSEQAATVADEADKWIHYFLYFLAILMGYFIARMLLLWSQTAANVATKIP